MKNKRTKKFLSAVAILAVSAATVATALPFAACTENESSVDYPAVEVSKPNIKNNVITIDTALGTVKSTVSGKTYWVSPNVELRQGTGTYEDPANILTILNDTNLQPGDQVLVMPGWYSLENRVYKAQENSWSGTYDNYIVVRVATSEDNPAIVDGPATLDFSQMKFDSNNRGVSINGNYVYWKGINVCGAGDNGLYISGSFNTVEDCEFFNNRDTGLQIGRAASTQSNIKDWPSYNLVKNCTSHNNYDNETYGENADGFAAKLTVGYGNVFDGCIAYRNSDDGWDLYAYAENGNIGTVIMYNCVAFENGYLEITRDAYNSLFPTYNANNFNDPSANAYMTRDGDGNGFKLGGSVMEGDVIMYNCLSFQNRLHGVTDNSNPGYIKLTGITSYDNSAMVASDGKIVDTVKNTEASANIDVSRQTYSYNTVNNVLSVKSSLANASMGTDAYRGTVSNSLLNAGSKTNVVAGSIEGDTKNAGGVTYTSQISLPDAATIFKVLPISKDADGNYVYAIDGANDSMTVNNGSVSLLDGRTHLTYRNQDGSINMGDLLAKTDAAEELISQNLGTDITAGSTLNYADWDKYTHFYESDRVDDSGTLAESIVSRTLEALAVNCDENAVYQDFEVPVSMWNASISWSTEDDDYLIIGDGVSTSNSSSKFITVKVYRPSDADKIVTLTATVTYDGVSDKKEFALTIKKGDPSLGTLSVYTQDGVRIYNGGSVIIDQYAKYGEPEAQALNGLYPDSEKYLNNSDYEVSTTYLYASDLNSTLYEVHDFTPSKAGVFVITNTLKLLGDGANSGQTASMTYTIYVASKAAKVDFANNISTVKVYQDGFNISGDTTSATGYIYALSSATELTDITADNIRTYEGVESYEFRANSISFNFTNPNSSSYYIYYAIGNLNGEITSKGNSGTASGIYRVEINALDINNENDFINLAQNGKLGDEVSSQTVYLLKKDLDFTDVEYTMGSGSFAGVFNGNGHTISNLSTTSQGVFYKVTGGTIMNVKFKNLTIEASAEKVGLVVESTGGYFYNISFENVIVKANVKRVAALIGHIGGSNDGSTKVYDTYISHISVVNDSDHKITASARAAGLVGYVQYYGCTISVDNCYIVTDLDVSDGSEAGGMIASWEDSISTDKLIITDCFYMGTIYTSASSTRGGGMLGYHKGGTGTLNIDSCISLATFVCGGVTLTNSLKNCSPIVGNYSSNATVTVKNCIALMEEYNSDYKVNVFSLDSIATASTFGSNNLDWDLENSWKLVYVAGSDENLESPYIVLNFINE